MIDLKYLRNEAESTCRYSSPYMSRKELGELLDMLDAANLDAARYQWLKENAEEFLPCVIDATGRLLDENGADRAIDAAMAATKGEQA